MERGDWMQTYTGRKVYVCDPTVADVDPVDIAHALSMICRFGGHCRAFYSVAQHSVLVMLRVRQLCGRIPVQLAALMHDATEAYVGDLIRPLKRDPFLEGYCEIEDRWADVIGHRFGVLDELRDPLIKQADLEMLATESRDYMNISEKWDLPYPPLPGHHIPWTPQQSKAQFLKSFFYLVGQR